MTPTEFPHLLLRSNSAFIDSLREGREEVDDARNGLLETLESLDGLVVRLQQIDVARQYLESRHMQNELSTLSRHPLYVGVPAVITSVFLLRVFGSGPRVFSPRQLFVVIPVAATRSTRAASETGGIAAYSPAPVANSATMASQNASRSSGLRLVTTPPSTTTSSSTHSPPAFRTSVRRLG